MLAEAITLDGGTVALILAIFLLVLIGFVVGFFMSLILAKQAGRASRARPAFYVLLAVEGVLVLASVGGMVDDWENIFNYVFPTALVLQLVIFFRAKRSSRNSGSPPAAPPPESNEG